MHYLTINYTDYDNNIWVIRRLYYLTRKLYYLRRELKKGILFKKKLNKVALFKKGIIDIVVNNRVHM